jgi:peptidoglycan hydrolase-like amidase
MRALVVAVELVRIGVFGLFHPAELRVRPAPGGALIVNVDGRESAIEDAQALLVRAKTHRRVTAAPRGGGEFLLSVPGRIERRFRGELEITAEAGVLTAVVSMDREIAVAAAVAAESPPGAAPAALEAQAVATRSFYAAARGRHARFDFCDTTHCQFLREAPAPNAPAARAARRTRGLVLTYRGAPIAAMFSASCGGATRALPEPGPGGYPYFAVACPYCRRGPRVRCSYCDPASPASGHGVGLCQTGAKGMAAEGATFREILARYFPGAESRPQL